MSVPLLFGPFNVKIKEFMNSLPTNTSLQDSKVSIRTINSYSVFSIQIDASAEVNEILSPESISPTASISSGYWNLNKSSWLNT